MSKFPGEGGLFYPKWGAVEGACFLWGSVFRVCVSSVSDPTLHYSIARVTGWLTDAAVSITQSPHLAEELSHEFTAILVGASRNDPPVSLTPQPEHETETFYDVIDAPPPPPTNPPPTLQHRVGCPNTNQCEAFTDKGAGRCTFVKQHGLRVCTVHLHYWRRHRRLPPGGADHPYIPDTPPRRHRRFQY